MMIPNVIFVEDIRTKEKKLILSDGSVMNVSTKSKNDRLLREMPEARCRGENEGEGQQGNRAMRDLQGKSRKI